jgi:hypothetical protein
MSMNIDRVKPLSKFMGLSLTDLSLLVLLAINLVDKNNTRYE